MWELVQNQTSPRSLFQGTTKTNVLGHHYFARSLCETSQIKFKRMAPTIAPKFGPTLRTGVGSTAGARAYGSPGAEAGSGAAKRQKMAGGQILQVSANLDRARRRTNPPRLATAKAATGAKGPEVIPSDENDKFLDKGMSTMTSRPRKVSKAMTGKAAKNLFKAPPDKARDFAVKGAPTMAPLTMDDNDAYVEDTTSNGGLKPRSTTAAAARARALANNVRVSGQVAATRRTERAS
jgi:hypothetical protein